MIEAALAQLRFAASLAFGVQFSTRSLERLIAAIKETQHEFGSLNSEGAELLAGPSLDAETRRQMQLSRFRKQATLAAKETEYYADLFKRLQLNPARLTQDELARLPFTSKEAVRDNPDAFVRRSVQTFLRAMTTGTTGKPTSICFSNYELQLYFALAAIAFLYSGDIEPEDIIQISTSARGTLGNVCFAGGCAHVGAQVYLTGVIDPQQALALLAEERHLPGKPRQTSVLDTYPSYLGELVEYGLRLGYRPTDFGLKKIMVGGELVSAGLKERTKELFGEVRYLEGYGMTEIWPLGGTLCQQGHLHFEPSQGLVEVCNPSTGAPVQPGEIGTLVITPFFPYRETTMLLRYDTGDAVQVLAEQPLTCNLRNLPATGHLQGKYKLAVQTESGWIYPRQIIEALEAVKEVPLPARFGFWEARGGVGVEVLVRENNPQVRCKLGNSLEKWGVPLRELYLCTDPGQLQRPYPLRGDLRENTFTPSAVPV
jgi:phenylacetate-coenzyme A ligase PaaK-like adenylate-forming protein